MPCPTSCLAPPDALSNLVPRPISCLAPPNALPHLMPSSAKCPAPPCALLCLMPCPIHALGRARHVPYPAVCPALSHALLHLMPPQHCALPYLMPCPASCPALASLSTASCLCWASLHTAPACRCCCPPFKAQPFFGPMRLHRSVSLSPGAASVTTHIIIRYCKSHHLTLCVHDPDLSQITLERREHTFLLFIGMAHHSKECN